ncbi:piggyBac transposable element-derived protein 3-like [Phymastichus coffea]|uniref:piggyBac transposable element-derived protein 3-like n=1 Tax=Phymastichus coffea TaxID=108790 RepID=UPI00273C7121|nr:piggyBac transposable element-derived protein 3-like [Phymastichus coffea]
MTRARRVLVTVIPSDSESIDGLCNSDIERNENEIEEEDEDAQEEEDDEDEEVEDEVLTEDEEVEDEVVEILEKDAKSKENCVNKARSKDDIPFTKNFGPNIPEDIRTPLDLFSCLFSEDILDLIVLQTNNYAHQNNRKQIPITKNELIIFLGINILMGIKKMPSYRDYWSSDPKLNDPYISSLMTVNRFGFFLGNIHMTDNSKEPKRTEPNYDKLYKLRPMIDKLNENFKKYMTPSKYQSIDESMIKFKGCSSLKQYMPQKPIKRGYKCWVCADESGYICEFQIYTGKKESTEKDLGPRVVKELTRELVGDNHHVYFDNYFTSVKLMIDLKRDNIFACGTVCKDRKRLPKSDIPDKNLEPGKFEYKCSNTGVRWIKWMDKKPVNFLSNYHNPSEVTTVMRKQKYGSSKNVSCPVMCSDYNKYMSFVDKSDQLISTYKIDRKSKK